MQAGKAKRDKAISAGTRRRGPASLVAVSGDVENAMGQAQLALYIGGMGAKGRNFYHNIATKYGYGDVADRIQALYLSGPQGRRGRRRARRSGARRVSTNRPARFRRGNASRPFAGAGCHHAAGHAGRHRRRRIRALRRGFAAAAALSLQRGRMTGGVAALLIGRTQHPPTPAATPGRLLLSVTGHLRQLVGGDVARCRRIRVPGGPGSGTPVPVPGSGLGLHGRRRGRVGTIGSGCGTTGSASDRSSSAGFSSDWLLVGLVGFAIRRVDGVDHPHPWDRPDRRSARRTGRRARR